MARPKKQSNDIYTQSGEELGLGESATNSKTPAVSIKSRGESFWRCGRQFTKKPIEFAVGELSQSDLERLMAETQLNVKRV